MSLMYQISSRGALQIAEPKKKISCIDALWKML